MLFTSDQISALADKYYQLKVTVKPLPGEIDLNFQIKTETGQIYTLKIANPQELQQNLDFQNAMIQHLATADLDLEVPRVVPAQSGALVTTIAAPDGTQRFMRLLTWIDGRCIADVQPHTAELMEKVGALCGRLSQALVGFDHPAAHRWLKWDPAQAAWTGKYLDLFAGTEKHALATYFYRMFEREGMPLFPQLRSSVAYADANDYNVLVGFDLEHPQVPGVIDFGDAVFTYTINDLAIAAAYMAMNKPDPLATIGQLTAAYHAVFPLTEIEMQVLFPLICARLLISVTCSAQNLAENPDNPYLQISDRPAWGLLEKMHKIPAELALATIRAACGCQPCPKNAAFMQWVQEKQSTVQPIVPTSLDEAVWLDLSVGSADLGNYADIENAEQLHVRILEAMNGKTGIGRYNEARPFYTTDAYEVRGNNGPEWRTIHIGLDIFMPPSTPVSAPLDGVVHSFQDNANDRDYGPAILLEHRVSDELTFYTLYGHLTRTSLVGLRRGQVIRAGEAFCEIGPMPENGNWSPHLHFQIMLDTMGWEGDFPGVAFPEKREIWTSICPDPWLLLRGCLSPATDQWTAPQILDYRKRHLGKNLSISYEKPLTMLRGGRQYLFDDTGRRYLDTVNNVAHVGHEHLRVVRAGQRQMAVLNTNTRYLNENLVRFSEALLDTFPIGLDTVFCVNSGSEATELALRLAKNYTQQQDIIAVEVGYHGNTQGCIDISSYKFDGPGGKGAKQGVHITPMPDAYRGLYRGNTAATGKQYADHLGLIAGEVRDAGRGVAAFICESVISCGGQVTLPMGYLSNAAAQVRAAGGLYIADEVQTGCGRHGAHFWAFQEHGVVPDIVTIGKPIGNGHPLGVVVTTRAIADAFANGMEYFNTFGGNPVSCAIGLEVLRVIRDEQLQENALAMGTYLTEGLRQLAQHYPIIGDIRGSGLFLGIELVKDSETLAPAAAETAYLANRMRELGILMSTDGPLHNVLKIKPPLVFGQKDAGFLLEMLDVVFREDVMRV